MWGWLHAQVLGIELGRWLAALLVLAAFVFLQPVLLARFQRLANRLANRTRTRLDDVLLRAAEKPARWFLWLVGALLAAHLLAPEPSRAPLLRYLDAGVRAAAVALAAWFCWRLVEGLGAHLRERAAATETRMDDQLVVLGERTLKIFLVVVAIIVVAQNLGFSISGLVASLGIGGIAVAMAARDTIANFFGSVMLMLDRPFLVGDWIKTPAFEGVVEEIGFRSTRIRTFERTLVVVPNAELANMVIDNIDARPVRRVKMRIGLTYDTTPAQMRAFLERTKRLLAEHPGVDPSFFLVRFDEFGPSELSVFVYYYTKSTVWDEHLAVREEINLKLMELVEELGLSFAFPTRTVHLVQEGGDGGDRHGKG